MQINMRSGKYRILANGETFLFDRDDTLSIDITDSEIMDLHVDLRFVSDPEQEKGIDAQVNDGRLLMTCYNFLDEGTGLSHPMQIATSRDRDIYMVFWTYADGTKEPKIRRVKYTIFIDDQKQG